MESASAAQRAVIRLLDPLGRAFARHYTAAEIRGLERIPEGPALLVGNHNAGVMVPDSALFYWAYARRTGLSDLPLTLGHELLFRIPGAASAASLFGIVPASMDAALEALSRGRKVLLYPGGDWEAMRPSRDRDRIDFGGRRGFIRLAMRARVPIAPIVAAGAHDGWYVLTRGDRIARALRLDRRLRLKVFPIAIALPTGLIAGPAPLHIPVPHKIILEVLDPIWLDGDPDDEVAVQRAYEAITSRMQRRLDELADRLPRRRRQRAIRRARARFLAVIRALAPSLDRDRRAVL